MIVTERAALIGYTLNGESRVGSGLWIGERLVLTADHCAKGTGHWVRHHGADLPAVIHVRSHDPLVDVAVLEVPDADPTERLRCARVDRSRATKVEGCQALGFPRWKASGSDRILVQIDGFVPTAEGLTATDLAQGRGRGPYRGLLALKATGPEIAGQPMPHGSLDQPRSPWGGMSGAVVVSGGMIIGVVRSHNLREGSSSLTITPIDAIDLLPSLVRERVWDALGVRNSGNLPVLPTPWPATEAENLAVPLTANGSLPTVGEVDMYDIGVSPSPYRGTGKDVYVKRGEYDPQVLGALRDHRFVLITGDTKAGKSRLAFEAISTLYGDAKLIVPQFGPRALHALFAGDGLRAATGIRSVLWLDNLAAHLVAKALDRRLLNRLLHADSKLILIGTMTDKQHAKLSTSDLLLPEAKWVLRRAEKHVRVDGRLTDEERVRATVVYPKEDFSGGVSIGERLAAAPELKQKFDGSGPAGRAVVQAAADWKRAGMSEEIPQHRLWELARLYLSESRPTQRPKDHELVEGAHWASSPIVSHVALISEAGQDERPCYTAHDYIVSYLDGQGGPERRPVPIPDHTWKKLLTWVDEEGLLTVGYEAALRRIHWVADEAGRRALGSDDPELVVVGRFFVGQVALGRGDYRGAVEAYRLFLAEPIDPQSDATLIAKLNIGRALDALGNQHEALEATCEVISSDHPELTASARVNCGKILAEQGRFDEAAPILVAALMDDDETVVESAHLNLALIAVMRNGDAEVAQQHLEHALKSPRPRIQAMGHVIRGKIAEDNGHFDVAKTEFERVLALDDMPFEERAVALANLGEIMRHMEGMSAAEPLLREAIATGLPCGSLPAKISLARGHLETEHFEEAEKLLKEVIASGHMQHATVAELFLGWLYSARGLHEQAVRTLTAVAQCPNLVAAHNALLFLGTHLRGEDRRAAQESLRSATQSPIVRVRAAASIVLGDLRAEEVGMQEAESYWRAAHSSGDAVYAAEAALRLARQHRESSVAISLYQEAMQSKDPDVFAEAADLLGDLYKDSDRRDEAAMCYLKAVDSGHPRWSLYARIDLALLEHEAGRLPEVESLLESVVESDNAELAGTARDLLAESRLLLGAPDRAVPLFRSILDTQQNAPLRVRANLGLALLMCGQYHEAEQHLAEAIAEADPEITPLATVNMGLLKSLLGTHEEAASLYRRMLDSPHPTAAALAALRLGEQLINDNRDEEARPILEAAATLEQVDPAIAQLIQVHLARASDDQAKAERLACDALTQVVGARRLDFLLQLGIVRLERGDDAGALEPLVEAAKSTDEVTRSAALHLLDELHRRRGETPPT
ncbi:tetratricopeptide repeat protein [Streptomyces sp. NPDC101151]|uniref:tetratricopeptide repeat protein n=1 Tax=Streptomyces sp. NPDC101151 TaxID=3366115 RepID=UPI00380FAD07